MLLLRHYAAAYDVDAMLMLMLRHAAIAAACC